MFLNIHRLFLISIPDKVSLILSILNLLFAEPVLLRLLISVLLLIIYGILSVLLSHLVVSLVHNCQHFVYKTMLTTVVNTVRWKDLAHGL